MASENAVPERRERALNALRIALSTFAILALELALIRWMSQQVRMFAYLNNVLLMSAFLGMGLGLGIGRRRPGLIHGTVPLLLVLSVLLSFSAELNLMRISLPDPSIYMWGDTKNVTFFASMARLVALIALVVAIFVCASAVLGDVFGRYGDNLSAYSWDLFGSLAGIAAMTFLAAMNTPPPVWFLVATLPLLWLSPRWTTWLSVAGVIVLAALSVRGALFSPYSRLDLERDASQALRPYLLSANRDAHQYLLDLSVRTINDRRTPEAVRRQLMRQEWLYKVPFIVTPEKRNALVVGAGTGNDVAAALRHGFQRVVAVEIDPVIYGAGVAVHPEKPYQDSRVEVVISDARTFFERNAEEKFDVVCFGLLDSHAMFSAMSSLRLDNYVYTVEAMRAAFGQVADGGVMTVSFSIGGGPWISDRIYRVLHEATGIEPTVIDFSQQFLSRTWLVGKNLDLAASSSRLPNVVRRDATISSPHLTTDDWPFLYLRPQTFPYGLLTVLLCLLAMAAAGARVAFGESFFTWRRFNASFFFLGAAFLLIETRGVTNLSLLFGSTWIVNSAVFGGILLAALGANFIVKRMRIESITPVFVALAVALAVNYFVAPGFFLRFSPGMGGILAALANGVPVGFAGIIFSYLLKRAADPASALGWNLLGAVLGGCLEYLSMAFGLRALIVIATVLYALAFAAVAARRSALSSTGS